MSVCCAWKEETEESKQQNTVKYLIAPLKSTRKNSQLQHVVVTVSLKNTEQIIQMNHDQSIL